MARHLRIIHNEAGNTTVGGGNRRESLCWTDNDAGSEIYLLPLNNKGIYTEVLFLNLDRPRGGVPVAAVIMTGQARVFGQEWDPDAE